MIMLLKIKSNNLSKAVIEGLLEGSSDWVKSGFESAQG
jgi:hypothetical protein